MKTVILLLSCFAVQGAQNRANPIRKVVGMLQAMQKKVEAEGKAEEELYKKFQCYCKNGAGSLETSIAAAEQKVPQTTADIESSTNQLAQLKEDLKNHAADRIAAKATMSEAQALRQKESTTFAAYKAEAETNLNAMTKAIAALEKGMGGAFLQTTEAGVIRKILTDDSLNLDDSDKEEVDAFLQGSSDYAPASGEITGILKQQVDEMTKALAEQTTGEESAIKTFDELMAAKTEEVETLTISIETKTVRTGELAVSIAEMKNDLADTKDALAEDTKFLANLDKTCVSKAKEWDVRQKMRAEEQLALSDTIKMLNDDDALELFKKTLPAPSFIQVRATSKALRAKALAQLRGSSVHTPRTDFIALALHNKKFGFGKVIKMIKDMMATLATEQKDDDVKKAACEKNIAQGKKEKADLERRIQDEEIFLEDQVEKIKATEVEIQALKDGIVALDKSVAEATEDRKAENAEFTELMASNNAAVELLGMAENRLNKFYNPGAYKAPPAEEAAPALVQITAHKAAPPPPPATFDAYSKKSSESSGVIGMIQTMKRDLQTEMTEAKMEEKHAQADYEETMTDSAEKRAADSKSLAEKEGTLADMNADLNSHEEEKGELTIELMTKDKELMNLKQECEFLLKYYDARKQARADEKASMEKEIEILSETD